MTDYTKKETTPEVWAVLRARHSAEMVCFGSYSAPGGDRLMGNTGKGRMDTDYGFPHASCPLIGISTTWDIDPEHPDRRPNERHKYWLCVPTDHI